MLGNCLGWVAYSVLINDLFVLASNAPGLILSFWLNVGAAKLEYNEIYWLQNHQIRNHNYDDAEKEEENIDYYVFTNHEKMVLCVLLVWIFSLSFISFYPADLEQKTNTVGFLVNINLVAFYGSPLSSIRKVLTTKSSRCIHRKTMIMSLFNSFFWMCYGIALSDLVIFVPNLIGFGLSILQMGLCMWYKNNVEQKTETTDKHLVKEKHILDRDTNFTTEIS